MRAWQVWIAIFVCGTVLASPAPAAEVIDRIVANVNGHPILQSDWDEQVSFEAFVDGKGIAAISQVDRKAALDRLIDQELLREQVHPTAKASVDVVASRIADIRKAHQIVDDAAWLHALTAYGLTQSEIERRLGEDIQLMQLVDSRLRPSVQIDSRAVESYYQQQLLPQLRQSGNQTVELPEVYGQIKDILTEQKVSQLLENWIASLRSEGHILTIQSTGGEQSR